MNFLKEILTKLKWLWKEANKPISLFEKEYWDFMKKTKEEIK